MSYSTVYAFFEDGYAVNHLELKNGWGSAPRVWTALCEKYVRIMYPDHEPGEEPFVMEQWQSVWAIEDKTAIPWFEHNVLHWTFDNALIKGEDIPLFVESLREFNRAFTNDRVVNHLPEVANTLEALYKEAGPKLLAIGHQHTSISNNQWQVYNSEEEEYAPYNMLKGEKHRFIEILGPDSVQNASAAAPEAGVATDRAP